MTHTDWIAHRNIKCLSPESELKIHQLAVFQLEVVFQLLNDHRVWLANFLLPFIFITPSSRWNINNNVIFYLTFLIIWAYIQQSTQYTRVHNLLQLQCLLSLTYPLGRPSFKCKPHYQSCVYMWKTKSHYLYMSEMVLICNFPLRGSFSFYLCCRVWWTRVRREHNLSLDHNCTGPDQRGSQPWAKNKHYWVECLTTMTTDLAPLCVYICTV